MCTVQFLPLPSQMLIGKVEINQLFWETQVYQDPPSVWRGPRNSSQEQNSSKCPAAHIEPRLRNPCQIIDLKSSKKMCSKNLSTGRGHHNLWCDWEDHLCFGNNVLATISVGNAGNRKLNNPQIQNNAHHPQILPMTRLTEKKKHQGSSLSLWRFAISWYVRNQEIVSHAFFVVFISKEVGLQSKWSLAALLIIYFHIICNQPTNVKRLGDIWTSLPKCM